jgi:hypothetical protein
MRIIDQYNDPAFAVLVHLVADRPKIAALVKDYDVDIAEAETLPDAAYAWPEKRAFPVHSREHTALSMVYRANMAAVPTHVDDRLKEACDMYDISSDLLAREKKASFDDPEAYLLPDLKRLPVRDAEQVKVAEQKLLDGYTKLSIEHRAMACKRLVDKAALYGVRLHPLMHKLAGYTISSTNELRRWLEARATATKEASVRQAFQKLADGLRTAPIESRDREGLVKLAEVIGTLDQRAGLTRHYDKRLPDPMQTVFNTEKIAGAGVTLGGTFVPMTRLAAYPATFYADILGDDFVREASDGQGGVDPHKIATILGTLPRDMQHVLVQQMR